MILLAALVVALVEGLLGPLGWTGRGGPDLALFLAMIAALDERRGSGVALAFVVGLSSGLLGTGLWGEKVLICVAAHGLFGSTRGSLRTYRPAEATARAMVVLLMLALGEFLWLKVSGRIAADDWTILRLVGRALTTTLMIGLWLFLVRGSRQS